MKTIIFTTLFAFLFSNSKAQTTSIEGKVIEKDSREPVLFAPVVIYKNGVLTYNVETDLEGNFMISDIQPGKYDIDVQYVGLKTTRVKDFIYKVGIINKLNIEMEYETEIDISNQTYTACFRFISIDNYTNSDSLNIPNKITNLPTKNINPTSLEGKVIDKENKEPILFGVVSLYKNGVLTNTVETDLDGNFMISDIQPGKYDVEIQYLGYKINRIKDIVCIAGQINRLNIEMETQPFVECQIWCPFFYPPLIEMDNMWSGTIYTSEKIKRLPSKSTL